MMMMAEAERTPKEKQDKKKAKLREKWQKGTNEIA
jgi:hypothetical protein